MLYEQRYLANGASLPDQQGRKVTIIVKVTAVDPHGVELSCQTSDNRFITVTLDEPLNGPITGWVEVIGSVTSNNKVRCSEIITFKENAGDEPFNTEAYDMAVLFWTNCKDIYETK